MGSNAHHNNDLNDDIVDFDPNETFTSKAKKALESYKVSKNGSTSSSDSAQENNQDELRRGSSKSKHAPLPFRTDPNEPKFVD